MIISISLLSYFGGESEKLVNRFSFAGVITSIILAVIAIFIAVIQNYLYSSTSEKLVETTDKIEEVNKKNEKTASKFENSSKQLINNINNLGKIEERTMKILDSIEDNKKAIKEINSTVMDLSGSQFLKDNNENVTFRYTKKETLDILNGHPLFIAVPYYIYKSYEHRKGIIYNDFEKKLARIIGKIKDEKNINNNILEGFFVGIKYIFEKFGAYELKQYEESGLKVVDFNEDVLNALKELEKVEHQNKDLSKLLSEINEEFND